MIVQDGPDKVAPLGAELPSRLAVKPKKIVFYTVFSFAFLLSGLIVVLDILPYRMNLVSLLVIPLLFLYGVRVDRVLITFLLLTVVAVISALVNQVSLMQLLLFLRSIVFASLIYSLVRLSINRDNIAKIIKICVAVGMLQLPVVLLQFIGYERLPSRFTTDLGISQLDYSFGTFHFKGDAAMTFFLTLLIIFLLFDHKRNHIIRHKWFVILWFTLTVLISNAELMKLGVIFVWIVFAIKDFSIRTIVYGAVTLALIVSILALFGVFDEIVDDFSSSFSNNLSTDESKRESFLSGGYGRGAAIQFYLDSELEIIGDGPSRYLDPLTRTRLRGNTGHIFTYYSEVGLVGLLISYLIFFLIAFPIRDGRIRIHWVGALIFSLIVLLSFTTEILANISIVMIFSIIAVTYLVPPKETEISNPLA